MEQVHAMIGTEGMVADIMAGTGSVSLELRKRGYTVIASDVMTYSYHHLVTNLQIGEYPQFSGLVDSRIIPSDVESPYCCVLSYLNELASTQGFFIESSLLVESH